MSLISAQSGSKEKKPASHSYGTILKSSSIIGGSKVLSYAIGLVATKAKALLLGPSGIGLLGIFNAFVTISQTLSNMGLSNSGVREIASQSGEDVAEARAQLQLALRRLGFVFASLLAIFVAIGSPWISQALFQTSNYGLSIALLGILFLLSGLNIANQATLQGLRQIFKIGKASILSALFGAILSISIFYVYGIDGIVPALLATGCVTLLVSYRFARPHFIEARDRSWKTTYAHATRLVPLGASVAWGALVAEIPPFFARATIVRELGVEFNGYYVAAWAISGLFINFLITALSVDFFPRLSAVAKDPKQAGKLISEQTEIGIIAALPGVLALILFAPLIIQLLYSKEFLPAAALMPWFVLGLFGRIVCWPTAMIVLAKGDARFFSLIQTISVFIHLLLQVSMFQVFGLEGFAVAFALQYIWYYTAMRWIAGQRYAVGFSASVNKLLLISLFGFLVAALNTLSFEGLSYYCLTVAILLFFSAFSVWQLTTRMKDHPKVAKLLVKLPFFS